MNFNLKDYCLLDDIGPEKIMIIKNPSINLNGVLVIDNSVYGIPAGGVRIAPDISLDEMVRLARAMSLKFCAYRLKVGGAKAGIWGDPLDTEKKNLLLTGFANAIESLTKNDLYYPGPDMGTDDYDLFKIFSVMGVPNLAPKPIGLKKNGIPVEELFTGYGVVNCIDIINNNLDKFTATQREINQNPKVILEGFGKVGTALAIALDDLGYRLMGLSTLNGAIYDDDGLDIHKLLELKKLYKDDLINHYESKNVFHLEKGKLFELSNEFQIDFIIPGARPDVINKLNADKINVTAIVPAANIPYEKGVIEILNEKNILAFPDFIANAGEVLAILVNKIAKSADEIFEFIKSKISDKTFEVIQGANNKNTSPYEYAVNDALVQLTKKIERKKNLLEKLNKRC